jgi:phage gp29-like protein
LCPPLDNTHDEKEKEELEKYLDEAPTLDSMMNDAYEVAERKRMEISHLLNLNIYLMNLNLHS